MTQVSMSTAYIIALVVMIVAFLAAYIIAGAIPFRPDDTGTTKRRLWFWLLAAVTPVVAFLINALYAGNISVPNIKDTYIFHSGISCACSCILYIVLGFIISKSSPNSKVGTWFN
ncbi:MAG: hypothetical protein K2G35_02385 [Duncaniella sp.]|nr:hypothetical protein [Duncaniella sp.]